MTKKEKSKLSFDKWGWSSLKCILTTYKWSHEFVFINYLLNKCTVQGREIVSINAWLANKKSLMKMELKMFILKYGWTWILPIDYAYWPPLWCLHCSLASATLSGHTLSCWARVFWNLNSSKWFVSWPSSFIFVSLLFCYDFCNNT